MSDKGYTDYNLTARVPDGLKFSNSLQNPNAVSPLLRNIETNDLETHAQLILEGKSEEGVKKVVEAIKDLPPGTKLIILAGAVVVVGGAVVVGKNWDSVKNWGVGTFNKLRPTKATISRASEVEAIEIDIAESSTGIEAAEISTDVEVTEARTEISLTSEQWRQLLQGAMAMHSWEEQIWLLLSSAAIEDRDEKVLEWQQQMRELSPTEAAARIRGMIEAHPELKDDDAIAELMKLMVRRLNEEGEAPRRLEG